MTMSFCHACGGKHPANGIGGTATVAESHDAGCFLCLELTMQAQQGKEKSDAERIPLDIVCGQLRKEQPRREIQAFVQQKSLDEQWSPEQMAYRAKLENSLLSGMPPNDLSSH